MYWRLISRVRTQVGRKPTPKEVRELIFYAGSPYLVDFEVGRGFCGPQELENNGTEFAAKEIHRPQELRKFGDRIQVKLRFTATGCVPKARASSLAQRDYR